jgi:hypothetical protein
VVIHGDPRDPAAQDGAAVQRVTASLANLVPRAGAALRSVVAWPSVVAGARDGTPRPDRRIDPARIDPRTRPAALLLTSGTTSEPKATVLSHAGLYLSILAAPVVGAQSAMICGGPQSSIALLLQVYHCIAWGSRLILAPPSRMQERQQAAVCGGKSVFFFFFFFFFLVICVCDTSPPSPRCLRPRRWRFPRLCGI